MSIWKKEIPNIQTFKYTGMIKHVGIEILEVGNDFLRGHMPVDDRTKQPLGLLHGGASCVLAETLGSYAANLCCDKDHYAVGLEINANHIKSLTEGYLIGTARPHHLGRSTQVWSIEMKSKNDDLVCISRLTVAVKSH